MTSKKPYILRAIYDWISDNSLTPYIVVNTAWPGCRFPKQYAKDDRVVFNVTANIVQHLVMGNTMITFIAQFSGVPNKIEVPMDAVVALYAKENGEGTSFPESEKVPLQLDKNPAQTSDQESDDDGGSSGRSGGGKGKPNLRIV